MSCDARLKLIQDALLLLQEESVIFASQEDAQYFRAATKKKTAQAFERPVQLPPPVSVQTAKTPPPAPVVVSKASPPPSPPVTPVLEAKEPPVSSWRSEAPISSEPLNFGSLRALFQKTFPHIPIIDEIPNDAAAKKQAMRWKTKNQIAPISILYFSEPPEQKKLLTEIVKAIDIYFGPARMIDAAAIEKEKQWETFLSSEDLKLVISCDYTLWQLIDLMRFYKEVPSQQTRTLGNIPLFLLPDLSLYLKDPLLKRSLWKSLCIKLST